MTALPVQFGDPSKIILLHFMTLQESTLNPDVYGDYDIQQHPTRDGERSLPRSLNCAPLLG